MTFIDGPFVQAAGICENIIEDKSGAISIIRLIDTFTTIAQGPEPPEDMPPVNYPFKLIVALKSGLARGRSNLKIVPELPNGSTKEPLAFSVNFDGEERGANVIVEMIFTFELEGLYWFNIYLEDQRISAIPFRVKYQRRIVTTKL